MLKHSKTKNCCIVVETELERSCEGKDFEKSGAERNFQLLQNSLVSFYELDAFVYPFLEAL